MMDYLTRAHIQVPADYNLERLATVAGNPSPDGRIYADGILFVDGVTQSALDDALAGYDHEEWGFKQYIADRARHYPSIGDQLDAILKIFLKMKTDGNDLPPDLDAIIDQWQAVKEQFPKPE